MEKGYLYIVTGKEFYEQALTSAKSLREVDKDAHITLITTEKTKSDLFDNIIIKQPEEHPLKEKLKSWKKGLLYKVENMYGSSPYKKTFFVDADTYFCYNCTELFDILEYYDICISHSPSDRHEPMLVNKKKLPGYYAYNTGVILFNKNENNEQLFENWLNIYRQKIKNHPHDQGSFMESLLTARSRVYVLHNIYNARTGKHISFIGRPVKIIHGIHSDYKKVELLLNYPIKNRSWNPKYGKD